MKVLQKFQMSGAFMAQIKDPEQRAALRSTNALRAYLMRSGAILVQWTVYDHGDKIEIEVMAEPGVLVDMLQIESSPARLSR